MGGGNSDKLPRFAWLSALGIFVLYLAMLAGVSVARDWLAAPLLGSFTVGEALLVAVHVLPVVLGIEYVRRSRKPESGEESE